MDWKMVLKYQGDSVTIYREVEGPREALLKAHQEARLIFTVSTGDGVAPTVAVTQVPG